MAATKTPRKTKAKHVRRGSLMSVRRTVNPDGTINLHKTGVGFSFSDSYHSLLAMTWPAFIGMTTLVYLGVNILFASFYFACGTEALSSLSPDPTRRFLDVFFFSVQTFSTIGYGKITPVSLPANFLVVFEALLGILGFALITGLLFARFSRPTARFIFSRVAIVSKVDGVESLIFRVANRRLNRVSEAQVNVVLVRDEETKEGETFRNFIDLDLERNKNPIFYLSWTVIHPITEKSPLYKLSREEMAKQQLEIIATISGIDETFSQTIHSRTSYHVSEIHWEHRFLDMLKVVDDTILIDLEKIHSVEPIENVT